MKIAYYIGVHHKPYQFNWLFSALANDSDLFFIHVDKKAPGNVYSAISDITGTRGNVTYLPRHVVNWGGWSQVSIELDAISAALRSPHDWQYFVNLSGQDYPIQSLETIYRRLKEAWPRNFIRVWSFDRVRLLEPDDPHLKKQVAIEFATTVRVLPFRLPRTDLNTEYKGSSWHILSREFCEWLVMDPVVRRLKRYIRFSSCPDEIFFQAAIMNSPFHEARMEDAGRLFFFPGPKTLDATDLPRIFSSQDLFARKFDAEVDQKVLKAVAEAYGYPVVS